ncbi:formimidoylglutamate deiminase [Roseateles amylovorans]|uniref:Formimidoylglutamate deiminase n=1 Tax=Roseateles amylovorans TaxID=2978473 RepID=A0ABY6B301_9BURK|nr:formimidoylglutamate deiminase [Roseateles amylovorans]UXH79555.1 formimidoylglutamate deiminase [Roseateles amylovorans]
MSPQCWHAPQAWMDGRWQADVLMEAGADGRWRSLRAGQPAPDGVLRLDGPVLPSLVDAHSHAFQRAFAGLAEQRDSDSDDFWSWRDRMYGVALRVTPEQLKAIAAQLYTELLAGGYTQVCEFHYLQHREDGRPYEDELSMSWALAEAAREVGIGLTLLPVLYAHAGFTQPGLRDTQRRFRTDADWVWRACERINAAGLPLVNAGVALHSLRAAHPADIQALRARLGDAAVPIHIHVAEQQQEVADCLAATGLRPLEALAQSGLDARWQLVHATHSTREEIDRIAASGAGVVICPGTEANLGDGLADLDGWLRAGVPMTVGSDSQVTRGWVEELRWLEYGQRLGLQRRNVAAQPGRQPRTAARLFEACVRGSAAAAGLDAWGLTPGARADFLVLDPQASGLAGLPPEARLDGLVFASQGPTWHEVYVAGQRRTLHDSARLRAFEDTMAALWR